MFRKKLYYSVLISAVFLTFEPVFAAEIHVSTWDELKSAVENGIDGAGAGGTVYLDKNIDVPDDFNSTITTAVPGIVIDGQGNTITTITGSGREAFDFSSSAQTDLQIKNVVFESVAITNEGTLGNINADFINNKQVFSYDISGGAIDNNNGTIGDITGDFTNNHVQALMGGRADGGAIDNSYGTIGDITGDFSGNYAQSGINGAYGGAISNYGIIGDITGDFTGNYVKTDGSDAYGGAIDNNRIIGDIIGNFTNNYTQSSNNAYGGAIYNYGIIGDITGDFSGNYVQSDGDAVGGAILNGTNGTMSITNSSFYDNYAQSDRGTVQGGAIANAGNMTITADNGVSEFSGNKVIMKQFSM